MQGNALNRILTRLGALAETLCEDSFNACVRKIERHERIFVCGAGRSGLMLRALAMRLMQSGRCAYVVGETVTPSLGEGDLLIAASASGSTYSVCHNAETAKKCGADLLIITAARDSELTRIAPADLLLDAPHKDSSPSDGQVMGSLFEQALLLICDAMVSEMAPDPKLMRKNHANLE